MLNSNDSATELREKIMLRIAAIDLELHSMLTDYKLCAARARNQDYRPVCGSSGQTENLKFIRENTAAPSHNLFYIGPRNCVLSWRFIYSLPEVPRAEAHQAEIQQAGQGWEHDDELEGLQSPEREASQEHLHPTRSTTQRNPSSLPHSPLSSSTSLSESNIIPSAFTESISTESTSNRIDSYPLRLIREALCEHWMMESAAELSGRTLCFGPDETLWSEVVLRTSGASSSRKLEPRARARSSPSFFGLQSARVNNS
jgi:hypothetical protein